MRSHDDPAVDRVIVYQVVRDQVVVGLAGIVADEYPSGVAKDDVVGHDRMIESGQMPYRDAGGLGDIVPPFGLAESSHPAELDVEDPAGMQLDGLLGLAHGAN